MPDNKHTDFDEFERELLQKPEIRHEYEALKPRYDMIRNLIARRNKLGLSQTELARMVGTQQPAISRLEKGDTNTTLKTLFQVADALNMDVTLKARKPSNVHTSATD